MTPEVERFVRAVGLLRDDCVRVGGAALCLVLLLGLPMEANAQNWTINSPGSYVMAADTTSTGQLNIVIASGDVILDLGGKTVRCDAADGTSSFGILASNQTNVTVRNGRIVGCQFGIMAGYSEDVVVEHIDFTEVRYVGVNGAKIVRDSVFSGITGWTNEAYAVGVNAPSNHCVIERNQFRNLYRQPGSAGAGEGVGVIVSADTVGCTIRHNWFENTTVGGHMNIGIWIAHGAVATIVENVLTNFERGIRVSGTAVVADNRLWLRSYVAGSNGIDAAAGSVEGNLIVGFETPVNGDAPNSGNLIVPP